MSINNKFNLPTILLLLSIFIEVVLISDNNMKIGHLIGYIFPCETPPMNSFPCYGFYSLYLFIGFLLLIFGLIGFLIESYVSSKSKIGKTILHKITNTLGYALLTLAVVFVLWMIYVNLFLRG